MKLYPTILGVVVIFLGVGSAQTTWPSSTDELEDVMFLNSGYRSRGFGSHVTPCSFSEFGVGRQTAAEWLRIGFHDMATTNVFNAPHGGVDGSIQFELNSGENIGAGFNTTLHTYSGFYNSQLSIGDLIALGVYASVRTCGGPVIPMRGGRIDVTKAGPIGVPQPQNGQGVFSSQFLRMGFNTTDMIAMTVCGHTIGGVHAADFNNIVVPGTAPNDFQLFDDTELFDNNIATRYINGNDTDPLAVGISISSGRNSDTAVFTADQNVTAQAMTNTATFNSMCASILQRMIETVDPSIVTLSPVIAPYEVKPTGLQLTLLSGGSQLLMTGDIRVRTTVRSASQISSVQLAYKDRTGAAGGNLSMVISGTASGFDDSFTFFGVNAVIPSTTSISSFTVLINLAGCTTELHDNNGFGFPVSDSVIVQTAQSCLTGQTLNVVAAVRSTVTTPVSISWTQKVATNSGSPIPSPVPTLVNSTVAMIAGSTVGPYVIYSGSLSLVATAVGTKYGVSSAAFADAFKDVSNLGATCGTIPQSSIVSSVSGTATSGCVPSSTSSTSPTVTPTLSHKQTVGAYSFQGCYTEGNGARALASASFYNYTSMTIEQCMFDCAGYSYFGVEYGGECYCGNSLASTSTLATLSDCSFICPGNSYEYCGAGNRLEIYLLTTLASGTSSSVSVSSTSSSKSSSSSIISTPSSSTSKVSTSTSSSSVSSVSSVSSKSSASSSATPTQTLHIVPSAGLYNYYGCYTEGTNVRALGSASYPADSQTIEACVASCSPYLYAGAEYGRECWCANSFGAGSIQAPNSECNMACAGNQYEYCGAGNRLSVYIRNGTSGSSSSAASSS